MEINLLRKITRKRALNSLKIMASYQYSRITRKPVVWGIPISFSIEPTNRCNFQCPECPSGLGALTRPLGMMPLDPFKNLIDQIASESFYLQLFLQGEPYINKQLPEMIMYARQKGMYVSISTNGSFISERNVEKLIANAPDKIIYSMDGLDEETYQNYRIGGTFAQADKGLRLLLETRKRLGLKVPYVELQFIVMKQNEHQVEDVVKYGKALGADKVVLKTMQVYSVESARNFLPENLKYQRYIVDGETLRVKGEMKNQCFALWQTSVVTWDGVVVPCCFDKDAEYPLGNSYETPFREIWNSPLYHSFRQRILNNRKGEPMCTNCTAGMKMNILET